MELQSGGCEVLSARTDLPLLQFFFKENLMGRFCVQYYLKFQLMIHPNAIYNGHFNSYNHILKLNTFITSLIYGWRSTWLVSAPPTNTYFY